MSWAVYLGGIAFFTVVFLVLYAITWSVLLQVRENYYRYYQKADLQWTGRESRFPHQRLRPALVVPLAFLTAWLVVHWVSR